MSADWRLFRLSALIVLAITITSCIAHQSTSSPTASPADVVASPSATPKEAGAPTGTPKVSPQVTATETPTGTPTATFKVPPRPTGISKLDVTSREARDPYIPINPMELYWDPETFVGEKLAFSALVLDMEEMEDEAGPYSIVWAFPDTDRGIVPQPWLIYFSETISVSRGLWLDVFGVGSGWITTTDQLGQEMIIPLIAASGHITYTERPHYCSICEQYH